MSQKTTLKQYDNEEGVEVGLDEAGRGCLFGPVFVAGVIWLDKDPNETKEYILKDSKKCSEKKRILLKIVKYLLKKGSILNNLYFVIGPSIAQKNYEVGIEFKKKFFKQDIKNKKYFRYFNKRIFFSLNDYIKGQLEDFKIKHIEIIKKDTYNQKNNFFSSRRSKKNNHDYGRNISVIMIK